jgi:hypothetical protein
MKRNIAFGILVGMAGIAASNRSLAADAAGETEKTEAAVLLVDQHWTDAEVRGDVAYVDQLLLPGYRTVNPDGIVKEKADILESARKNGQSDTMASKVAQYLKDHPMGKSVALEGDTAVVTFYSEALGPQKGLLSCDVFVYLDGRWHALYSQHTTAEKWK